MRTDLAGRRRTLAATATVLFGLLTSTHAAPSSGVRLDADTGLGGVGRPGRWVPVRVTLVAEDDDVSGEIIVEWGDARLSRPVQMTAPSRIDTEVYIRTLDVRDTIGITLVADGRAIAAAEAPIRMASEDEPLIVCAGGSPVAETSCTVAIPPARLPRSMRGYAAADEVVWQAGPDSVLAPEQRDALQRWRALHAAARDEVLVQAPRPAFDAGATTRTPVPLAIAAAGSVAALLVAAGVWMAWRGRAWVVYAVTGLAVVIGTGVTLLAGRVGPGAAVLVRHVSTVHQLADGSLVSQRLSVEYPAYANYMLTAPAVDAALWLRQPGRHDLSINDSGDPVRRGTFGRGKRENLEFEGFTAFAPFEISTRGNLVRVANRSDRGMKDCRFSEGFVPADAVTLEPGEAIEAHAAGDIGAPFFACTTSASPVAYEESSFPVQIEGYTVISVPLHLERARETP